MGSSASKEPRYINATIVDMYDYPNKGYIVYKLENPSFDQRVAVLYKHPDFAKFKRKLQRHSVHRCVLSRKYDVEYHCYEYIEHIPELINVLPVLNVHMAGRIDNFIPYKKDWSELILEQGPIRISENKWWARLIIESKHVDTLLRHVDVDLTIEYVGDINYRVKAIRILNKMGCHQSKHL